MPKVRIEFNTDDPGDTLIFMDGEDVTRKTEACHFWQESKNFPMFYISAGKKGKAGFKQNLYFGPLVKPVKPMEF